MRSRCTILLSIGRSRRVLARDSFSRALSLARVQQARSWELRAATSMARLWLDRGMREKARDLLAPIYAWFTEGLEMADLKEAKTLLIDISPCGLDPDKRGLHAEPPPP
jgi:predicted ATPase